MEIFTILSFIIGIVGLLLIIKENIQKSKKLTAFIKQYPEEKGLQNIERSTVITIYANTNCKARVDILTVNLSKNPIKVINYEIWGGFPVKHEKEIKFRAYDWQGKLKSHCTQNSETFKRFEIRLRKPLKPLRVYKYCCLWEWQKSFPKVFEKEWYETKIVRPSSQRRLIIKFPQNTELKFFKEHDFSSGIEHEINVIKRKIKNRPIIDYTWVPQLGRRYRFTFAVAKKS